MNRILSLLICTFLIISCGNKREGEQKTGILSNFLSISDNEDNGVKEVLGFYGGQCKYAIGVSASTENGKRKYFELEISQSDVIYDLAHIAEMPASNVAYLFYKNLKEEKSNYNEIHSIIVFKDGTKQTFKYSTEQLELVVKRIELAYKTVELIKNRDFENLNLLINSEEMEIDKDLIISDIRKLEPQLGNINEFIPHGFRVNKTTGGINLLHISGALIRELKSNEFSIDVDLNSEKEEILKLGYKF